MKKYFPLLLFCFSVNIFFAQNKINYYEYWFDNDYAGKVSTSIAPIATLNLTGNFPVNTLANGLHSFHIRFRDDSLYFSSVLSQFIYKFNNNTNNQPNIINAYRYWFDNTDTTMVNVGVNTTNNSLHLITQLNVSYLDTGYHHMYIQFQDSVGLWSSAVTDTFMKLGRPRVDYITPDNGGNIGDVTVNVYGTGFYTGTIVKLIKPGIDTITGPDSLTLIDNGTRIQSTLDLRNAAIGYYNVVVEVPGDTTMTIINGFRVVPGIAAQPWSNIVGFNAIRLNQWQTYTIQYGNNGNVDAKAVPLYLALPQGAQVEFNFVIQPPNNPNLDFDTIPLFHNTDSVLMHPFQASVYSFIIPNIPPGGSGSLTCKIKVTSGSNHKMSTWVNPPLYSPLSLSFGDCAGGIIELLATQNPLFGCMYGTLDIGMTAYIQNYVNPNYLNDQTVGNFYWSILSTGLDCATLLFPPVAAMRFISNIITIRDASNLRQSCMPPLNDYGQNNFLLNVVTSFDPNEKLGPSGAGQQRYYSDANSYGYTIHYENADSATANAQIVLITDTLNSTFFDFNTFELGLLQIGDSIIEIPQGRKDFQTLLNFASTQNVVVRITAHFNDTTGVANWYFESLDPFTLLPVLNPLQGFLPPNVNSPEGEGAIFYSVHLRDNLPNNTVVTNKAYIYFDGNAPIATDTWSNAVDNIKPHSQVLSLASTQPDTVFLVSWAGIDTSSGIQNYSIYFSTNGGPYHPWLLTTYSTSEFFTGKVDSTYSFYSVATDSAGNRELAPLTADATTTVILGVSISSSDFGFFRIYPNPVASYMNVEGSFVTTNEVEFMLFDMNGITILNKKIPANGGKLHSRIDLNDVASGVYFYELKTNSGKYKMGKLVIQ